MTHTVIGKEWRRPALIETATPVAYSAASMPGAEVLGDDGRVYRSERWPTSGDPYRWVSAANIAEDVASGVFRVQGEAVEITIGAGGDFATLNEALDWSLVRRPADIDDEVVITARILSGTTITEQIVLSSVQLSHVRIVSDDAEVPVDVSSFAKLDTNGYASFITAVNASTPEIGCIFRRTGASPVIGGETRITRGARVSAGSSMFVSGERQVVNGGEGDPIAKFAGFKGFDYNIELANVSPALILSGADLGDAVQFGLSGAGVVHLYGCVITGCGVSSIRIDGGIVRIGAAVGTGFHVDPAVFTQDFRKTAGVDDPTDIVINYGILQVRPDATPIRGGCNVLPNSFTQGRIYLHGYGPAGRVAGLITPSSYAVATLPSAAANVGVQVYVTDGAAGLPIMAFSDGTDWLRCDTRAAVSAT